MSLPVTLAKGIGITSLFLVRNAPTIFTAGGAECSLTSRAQRSRQIGRAHV